MDSEARWENIPNPTTMNARRQLNGLFESLPQDSPLTIELRITLLQNDLLPTLSHFMLRSSLTMAITWAFRPLLMDLCARWLDTDEENWGKLEASGLLIEIHEELFPILSSFLRRFDRGPLRALLSGQELHEIDRTILHRVLLAYYRILRATPSIPRNFSWDLACLLRLCATADLDRGARWLAIRCYSLQACMSETVRLRMEQDALGEIYDEDCPIFYGEDIYGVLMEMDGWILPVLEERRIRDSREALLGSHDYFAGSEESDITIQETDLCPRIANVQGILLLRPPSPTPVSSSLVLTSSAVLTLRRLAVNFSLRRPTLLTSVPSSGKATFLNYLSGTLYPSSSNPVITIHLADTSLDPRSLLGSYVSSTTSTGSFEWKDGVLVKAIREGRWVVLKDIDRASSEVLSLISPLVESMDDIRPIGSNATLSIGNRGTVEASETFALFATRSVERDGESVFPPSTFLGAQKWHEITIPENSLDDLRLIVDSKFPVIAGPVSDCLIDIWLSVKRQRALSSTRTVGIRDLEKFSFRVSRLLETSRAIPSHERWEGEVPLSMLSLFPYPSIREEIYMDARDVFFAAGAPSEPALAQRQAIAATIGEKLGLPEDTREWILKSRTPAFEIERDVDGRPVSIRTGRTSLLVHAVNRLSDPLHVRPFSLHKHALRLISQIAACAGAVEPTLLTGETGTGKTSVISHLASLLNKPLVSLNLSQQTESSDLIGGFRPVSARVPALELQERFTELFRKAFSSKRNEQLLQTLRKAIAIGKWKTAVKLWSETAKAARDKLREKDLESDVMNCNETVGEVSAPAPRKRRKVQSENPRSSIEEWNSFESNVRLFEVQHVLEKGKFSFRFVEGPLVRAIRTGAWVLLDEINLASPETLECITALLQGPEASITLTEQGSLEPVPRHSEFRLFACMNPATDVGKKDLPANIRGKFTEIEVPPPDDDPEALISIIAHYIGHLAVTDKTVISDVAELYTSVKQLAGSGKIADGNNHRPQYSIRSLSRALTFAADMIQSFSLRRALWEGFIMTFTISLDQNSADIVLNIARRTLLSSVKNTAHFLAIQPPPPQNCPSDSYVQLGPFWLSSGPRDCEEAADYILTPSVQKKLVDLARIVMTKRYPVLIEGPTSSGKTSAIQYLARRTGHNFVRINNHEHTDIQEYLGSYGSDPKTGKLVYQDGLLVLALRRGDWIVLDELNLAPTDVLEALNRLLDDNRELVIPETQEVVKPHPDFMLFATQNPPGVYAGRRVLSRALRNRFLEVHFEDVPSTELQHILSQRSRIAPSYSQRIVAVFQELQKRRQIGRIFEGKEGFATLRDLFRWADRDAQGYQELAENGYMLLAERTRRPEDKLVVKEVIEKVMNVSISESSLYNMDRLGSAPQSRVGIVWTKAMQRLFILLSRALEHNEPVLLVGETGSGKTSVCQVYAGIKNKVLRTVNCHQNTEAADIIGGLRPVRPDALLRSRAIQEAAEILGTPIDLDSMDKAQFTYLIVTRLKDELEPHEREVLMVAQRALSSDPGLLAWKDGPLVMSMRSGDIFLLDEISLADDSVLERLNSVLEPTRILMLAEKGGKSTDDFEVVANPDFKFVATMNPGGDFGKKELSPALRNRFTEIWVPSVMKREELVEIVKRSWKHEELEQLTGPMLNFVDWLILEVQDSSLVTLRDILSWVEFCNSLLRTTIISACMLFVQGGEMTMLDGLYNLTQLSGWNIQSLRLLRQRARCYLIELCPESSTSSQASSFDVSTEDGRFRIGPFSIPLGPLSSQLDGFSFKAPTSLQNAFRLIRTCQITKPVLLEGSPGVGKTSLVTALAAAAGQRLCRINLSEQTDLVDLFGSDLPEEGHASGSFKWNDAEFLRALKRGDWVLLDEMNLASQAVLEGLNAVFDHRGSIYIPELDRTFSRHPNFRVFAAQNPLNQGSGRKGLPKSFLNRFTKIYVEELSPSDLLLICQHLYPAIKTSVLQRMVTFTCGLQEDVVVRRRFGVTGAPWEFNLRDLLRWASLLIRPDGTTGEPWEHVNTIYRARFRTESDRAALLDLFADVFEDADIAKKIQPRLIQTPEYVACGSSCLQKSLVPGNQRGPGLLSAQTDKLEPALSSLSQNWLLIVSGSHSSGKTTFVRSLASLSGRSLEELSLGSSSDTSDLVGTFEQTSNVSYSAHFSEYLSRAIDSCTAQARLDNIEILDLISTIKDEVITTGQTHTGASLQKILGSNIETPLFGASDADLRMSLEALLRVSMNAQDSRPRFEWVDGPLIQAMRQGQWLLLDNANLCSPAVLDRLNSLCETNGCIVLSERGVDQEVVYPHQDFRLIMTVDPCRGEISRAMRNRGIEVALESSKSAVDTGLLLDAKRLALHCVRSRPTFDLLRRALYSPSAEQSDHNINASIIHWEDTDTLSSQVKVTESLLKSFDSPCNTALALLVLCCSSPSTSRGILRQFKLSNNSRAFSLLQCLESCLLNSHALRCVLSDFGGSHKLVQDRYRPLHPFILHSRVYWLSDDDRKACMLISLVVEAYVLATSVEFELRGLTATNVNHAGNAEQKSFHKEHGNTKRFIATVPQLVKNAILKRRISERNSLSDVEILSDLMHYARYLHLAVNQAFADFSTLYAVSDCIYRCSDAVSHILDGLQERAQDLHEKYSLSSGQRVTEIWTSFYRPSMPSRVLELLNQLDVLPPDVQNRVADLIALIIGTQKASGDINIDLQSLEDGLAENLSKSNREIRRLESSAVAEINLIALTIELNEMASLQPNDHKSNLDDIVRLLKQSILLEQRVPRLIAYQLLLWKMNAKLGSIPELVDIHLEWHRALWSYAASLQKTLDPSVLHTPIFLRSTLALSDIRGALKDINPKYAQLKDLAAYALSERFESRTRDSLMIAFLLRNIELVLRACFPDLGDKMFESVALASDCRSAIHHLAGILQRPVFVQFSSLQLALNEISRSSSWNGQLQAVGRCWIALSRLLLSLYVPNLSVDPARVRSFQKSFRESRSFWLRSQIRAFSLWERCRTGHLDNIFTSLLQDRHQRLEADAHLEVTEDGSRGDDLKLLQSFWSETRSFLVEVISSERIEQFICATSNATAEVYDQELLLQDAITNFTQRMTKAYGSLQDLMRPVELALMQLRFGLGTLRHASINMSAPNSWMREIVTFPSVRARDAVVLSRSEDLMESGMPLDEALLFQLVALPRTDVRVQAPQQRIIRIRNIYERIMAIWDAKFVEQSEKDRQSESLYRSRQVTHELPDDKADDEILRLFPTFSEDDEGKSSDKHPDEQTRRGTANTLSTGFSQRMLKVHFLLFGSGTACLSGEYYMLWRLSRLQMVSFWSDGPLSFLPSHVDDESLAFRLDFLRDTNSKFRKTERVNAYSFYRDANIPEARKAANIVQELKDKLSKLFLAWPDQLVLQHLRDRCDNILSVNMLSPVAKILGAVERLLLHTEDWEMFANRENSLSTHRQALIDLIVSWRKLELTGWKSILDWEMETFCNELGSWWFRLYDTVIRGSIAAYLDQTTGALDTYLDSMTFLIEQFVVSSPLGQSDLRLKLIWSFGFMTSTLTSIDEPSQKAMKRVSRILFAIHAFYGQFADNVAAYLADQRASIEKDVQSLVKLATWKDVNVHALQASAQKTHRQLYKRIRTFRELLRQPITDHLQVDDSHRDHSSPANEDDATFVAESRELEIKEAPLKNLKFASILSKGLQYILDSRSTLSSEELSESIIFVEKDYAALAPPKDLAPNERKKWYSALLVRKKRSWHDLLKELKRIGLSPNVKPDILQRHRNRRCVMEQPAIEIPESASFTPSLKKIDNYFYRTISLLRELVHCDANHHPDIGTRELQRGVYSFESAFLFATSARARISGLTENWSRIRMFYNKLGELEHSRGTCMNVSSVRGVLQDAALKMTEAVEALNELLDVAHNIVGLSEDTPSNHAKALDRVRDWIFQSTDILKKLASLSQALECSNFTTEDDYNLIRSSLEHLGSIKALVADVSDREPGLRRFCNSIRNWFDHRLIETRGLNVTLDCPMDMSSTSVNASAVVDLFLVIGQDLLEIDSSMEQSIDDDSNHISRRYATFVQVSRALRMDIVLRHLRQLSERFPRVSSAAISETLSQVLPFLNSYISFGERYLSKYSSWTKSLLKLTYISGSVLRNIARNGFCRPPETEEAQGAGEGAIESTEGVGLGKGEGKEDASNQIEDESQFEGIKSKDDEPNGAQKENSADEAIDVDFDLGGESEEGPEQDTLSEGAMSDLDDEFDQNASDDLKPVDEEFWNEQVHEGGTQDQDVDDREKRDGKTEMVAKEQDYPMTEAKAEEDQERVEGAADQERDGMKDVEPDLGDNEEDIVRRDESDVEMTDDAGSVQPEDIPESRREEEKEEGESIGVQENDAGDEDKLVEAEYGSDLDQSGSTEHEDEQRDSETADAEVEHDNTRQKEEGDITAEAGVHAGNEGDGGTNMGVDNESHAREGQPQMFDETLADLPPSTTRNIEQSPSIGPSAEATDKTNPAHAIQADQKLTSRGTELGEKSPYPSDLSLPNPHRRLGDALHEVKRRFDEIMQATGAEAHPTAAEGSTAEQTALEYVAEESKCDDMEALGPALGEETAKLNKLSLIEEDEEMQGPSVSKSTPAPDDSGHERSEDPQQMKLDSEVRKRGQDASNRGKEADLKAMDVDVDHEGISELPGVVVDEQQSIQGRKVEIDLNNWLREGQPKEDAQRIWQIYDAMMQTLSFSLCEQLRLILEPTRATRLMGDFRTGKRLNMKKIIPYIASNYTKDKIWLRRVRPSQREYHVIIALDDSRSMAESHSIHLAFQTLALVSKALNRLEVGDIAIASFGEKMQIVHGFEDGPFTEQAGTKILETFKFAQTATDVRALLESSVEVLSSARERRLSSSSSDLWQLEIIISDGICQDHEELRAIMRKAEEQRILIVFIVIDADKDPSVGASTDDAARAQNSIVNMSQAMYRTVDGRLELHMQRYLDSFPFEFFVILKNVETLPDVLADTLRQFFERISAS